MLLTALNNVGPVVTMTRQHAERGKKNRGSVTYGVLMVRPRTAGTRETRAAAVAKNFIARVKGG